jgi:hypothetical protein
MRMQRWRWHHSPPISHVCHIALDVGNVARDCCEAFLDQIGMVVNLLIERCFFAIETLYVHGAGVQLAINAQ